jgi:serine/threonine protein phosphatase 1
VKNYWVIGDVHGEIRLLDRLLENILRFQPDQLVFVGDYIDRGPCSREVVDRIMHLGGTVTCLMGNHEAMMLNAMDNTDFGYPPVELWYYNGGETTLQSFGFSSFFTFQSDMDPVYLEFFRDLKLSHSIPLGNGLSLLVTHAGISPVIPLEEQLNLKNYRDLERYMLERHLEPGDSFLWVREDFFESDPATWDGYLVVHGHTPVLKLKRFISSSVLRNYYFVENDLCIRKNEKGGSVVSVDIDSGSVISGRLSGLGFFVEDGNQEQDSIRMRGLTVSGEDLFPRDLGLISGLYT